MFYVYADLCSLLTANSQVSILIGQNMQLTYCHNGNEMHHATCTDTQISIEWHYCSFPILCPEYARSRASGGCYDWVSNENYLVKWINENFRQIQYIIRQLSLELIPWQPIQAKLLPQESLHCKGFAKVLELWSSVFLEMISQPTSQTHQSNAFVLFGCCLKTAISEFQIDIIAKQNQI